MVWEYPLRFFNERVTMVKLGKFITGCISSWFLDLGKKFLCGVCVCAGGGGRMGVARWSGKNLEKVVIWCFGDLVLLFQGEQPFTAYVR